MTTTATATATAATMGSSPECIIDRTIMNKDTVKDMTDIGLSIFAPLCGKNRGAFVLDPTDGKTYGCIAFPTQFAQLAGVDSDLIVDSNSIRLQYTAGNITAQNVVDLIDLYVKSVYSSSSAVDEDPFACDAGGLAVLKCSTQAPVLMESGEPIRSATLAGLYVPALWATGGKVLTLKEAKSFYTALDLEHIKSVGLNAVQIPVPIDAFAANGNGLVKAALTSLLHLVQTSELKAILVVVDNNNEDNHEAIAAAAAYSSENNKTVLALTLPSITPTMITAARAAAPQLPLLVPASSDNLRNLPDLGDNVFAAVEMDHSTSVADVASSGSVDDRMKMFYHEATACAARSPIEYTACYRHVPVFISSGFDLSIDNCVLEDTPDFVDYGQCGRFDETMQSGWWERHRQSFAARLLFTFERGLGWSFSAWKLYGDDDTTIIDSPAKLLSLKNVLAAGLMPSLTKTNPLACLNPPVPDFGLGDNTLSPTTGPPPDCGNGWWNFQTKQCDYWIPPPDPTPSPSVSLTPTVGPCPVCLECSLLTPYPAHQVIGISAVMGAFVALVLTAMIQKCRGGDRGYSTLP